MLKKVFALVLLAAGASSADVFSFGLKTGIPINGLLTSAAPRFQVRTHRYTLGPTFELNLPHGLAFEVDLLYKRLEYSYSQPDSSIIQTPSATVDASRWELPVLLKYKIGGQHFQPFVDLGGSFNRVVHIEGMNVAELRHPHTRGVVIGAGLERRLGVFRLTSEVRFTRWADRNFGVHDAPLRSNLTQAEFLIGFRVLIRSTWVPAKTSSATLVTNLARPKLFLCLPQVRFLPSLGNPSQILFRAPKMDVFLAHPEPLVSVLDRLSAHFANLFGHSQFCSESV